MNRDFSNRSRALRSSPSARACLLLAAIMLAVSGCAGGDVRRPQVTVTAPAKSLDPKILDLAQVALDQGRYADAAKLMEIIALNKAVSPRARLLLAEFHLATGSLQIAADGFEALIKSASVSARALQGKGIALLLSGSGEESYAALKDAVEKDATLWRAWNALGYYYDSKRNWAESGRSYDKALAANPNSAPIYNNRGFSMLIQKRVDEAVRDLSTAVKLDPTLEMARSNLRLALAWKKNYRHAILGTPDKERGRVFNNVGFVALVNGDYATAESYFLRAMEADASFNRTAWSNLSYVKSLKDAEKSEKSSGK